MFPEFVQFQRFEVIVIIWLAFSAVADCAITVALVWHLVSGGCPLCDMALTASILLRQRKHKTGFAATDDIVNRIIRRQSFVGPSSRSLADLVFHEQSPCKLVSSPRCVP